MLFFHRFIVPPPRGHQSPTPVQVGRGAARKSTPSHGMAMQEERPASPGPEQTSSPPEATFETRFEQFYLQLSEGKTGGMVVSAWWQTASSPRVDVTKIASTVTGSALSAHPIPNSSKRRREHSALGKKNAAEVVTPHVAQRSTANFELLGKPRDMPKRKSPDPAVLTVRNTNRQRKSMWFFVAPPTRQRPCCFCRRTLGKRTRLRRLAQKHHSSAAKIPLSRAGSPSSSTPHL